MVYEQLLFSPFTVCENLNICHDIFFLCITVIDKSEYTQVQVNFSSTHSQIMTDI